LNSRTIQRIESNGVASLDTRGALANALGVMPEDLDVEEASVVAATLAIVAGESTQFSAS
jgi:hypothetical protein